MACHGFRGLVAFLLLAALPAWGCQPAGRYPPKPLPPSTKTEDVAETPPAEWSWMEPAPGFDVPIVFVPSTDPAWSTLPAFWNPLPAAPAGLPTCHLGLGPLNALASWALAEKAHGIKIKVPRGLPDPTPLIPRSNPPTLGKWKLGKSLFFAPVLAVSTSEKLSCASCHRPDHGFAEDWAKNRLEGKLNTPGLINVVYHKQFFWDGRVDSLEQTIVREGKDENLLPGQRASRHIWGGLVAVLKKDEKYHQQFQEVFGIRQPTQDAITQALATYMRTILSGDSMFDRALDASGKLSPAGLSEKHFETALSAFPKANLPQSLGKISSEEAARRLAEGNALFFGKARCHLCHSPPLFLDGDFHNIGLEDNDVRQILGEGLGRFDHVPIGLKEPRLLGAFRTPTLRALSRTDPYMHQGGISKLPDVVEFFDHKIKGESNKFLAKELLEGPGQARNLKLDAREQEVLVLFLQALDGEPVDPVLASPAKP